MKSIGISDVEDLYKFIKDLKSKASSRFLVVSDSCYLMNGFGTTSGYHTFTLQPGLSLRHLQQSS